MSVTHMPPPCPPPAAPPPWPPAPPIPPTPPLPALLPVVLELDAGLPPAPPRPAPPDPDPPPDPPAALVAPPPVSSSSPESPHATALIATSAQIPSRTRRASTSQASSGVGRQRTEAL